MSPILFSTDKWVVYSYGIFAGVGIACAMLLAERKALRECVSPTVVIDLAMLETIVLFVGARGWYAIQEWQMIAEYPTKIFDLTSGGFVFYGGLVLSIPIGLWYVWWRHQPVMIVADLVAPYIALGHAFGRVGCFLEGCCFGARTNVPWAVEFPKFYSAKRGLIGSPAFLDHLKQGWVRESQMHSLPVHPTQLYEAAALFILFLVLLWIGRKKQYDGQVLWAYFVLYAIVRFTVEIYRVNTPVLFHLSVAQITSVLLLIAGLCLFASRGRIVASLFPARSIKTGVSVR